MSKRIRFSDDDLAIILWNFQKLTGKESPEVIRHREAWRRLILDLNGVYGKEAEDKFFSEIRNRVIKRWHR